MTNSGGSEITSAQFGVAIAGEIAVCEYVIFPLR
jgi:hypothetical protein